MRVASRPKPEVMTSVVSESPQALCDPVCHADLLRPQELTRSRSRINLTVARVSCVLLSAMRSVLVASFWRTVASPECPNYGCGRE